MVITPERQGAAVVFNLDGPLTAETDTCRLHAMARSLVRVDARNLVLDLGHVCRLDSYGVGQLVEVYNEVRSSGLTLELANVEWHQKRLLELAGLLPVIPVFESRPDAAALGHDPAARPPAAAHADCQLDAA
jgi:stage II sporulation protein AA (anti-sigma F factor antagonist)